MSYMPKKLDRVGRGYPRSERKRQLVAALIDCANLNPKEDDCWFWTGELAHLVGLKNTPNFLGMLWEMYYEGTLLYQSAPWRPNQLGYRWSLSANALWQDNYIDLTPGGALIWEEVNHG
jgi:hypothetical protein